MAHPGSAFWRAALSPVFLLVLLCREGIKGENGESRKLSCALNQSGDFLGASSIQKFHRKSGLVRNSERNLPPEDSPVTWRHSKKFTLVSCVHFSSALMSPAE